MSRTSAAIKPGGYEYVGEGISIHPAGLTSMRLQQTHGMYFHSTTTPTIYRIYLLELLRPRSIPWALLPHRQDKRNSAPQAHRSVCNTGSQWSAARRAL